MNEKTKAKIDRAFELCMNNELLDRQQIIELLNIDPDSEEALYLRKQGGRAARLITDGEGCMWGAIGVDMITCPVNCKFCSFGEAWGIIKEKTIYTEEEILKQVKDYVDAGVRFIVLRTTEYYDLKDLCNKISDIRKKVPGNYEMILNTGEFDNDIAFDMVSAGTSGIYHTLRLREGTDTGLEPKERLDTMKAVQNSPLKLISLVEPAGREHTSEEIADIFLTLREHNAYMLGTMARVPVKGTPLGDIEIISDVKLAQLTAVFRLACSYKVKYICVHPASREAVEAGANVVVIEKGAIPRDSEFAVNEWNTFTASDARKLLETAGYKIISFRND